MWIGCKDSKNYTYQPKDKEELLKLVRDKSIKLNEIDTSAITDMSFLFANPKLFRCKEILQEQELSESAKKIQLICQYPYEERDFSGIQSWNVSNVEDMQRMFLDNKSFNESLNDWNVSQV
ncbi:BspA family leucine-rich repeat surface protein, partial [Helicobacter typhlonius]|uniref:BspA family leucine-rich repeat surface protein n=1 Tax=Helicobacter typhlonius TaxID=76936 RepID=UPI002FE1453F